MKAKVSQLLLGCVFVAHLLLLVPTTASSQSANTSRGDYIVVYKKQAASKSVRQSSVRRQTIDLEKKYGFKSRLRYSRVLRGFSARLDPEQVAMLRGETNVARIVRDRLVHALGRVPLTFGETIPSGVARIGAVSGGTAHEASSAAVAVIDTGIDLANAELNSEAGVNCTGGGDPDDDNGHGTYVAGIIGARNEGEGVVGVAPGTKLYAVKVLDADGSGLDSMVICGIDWVTANAQRLGIKVANLSLGGPGPYSSCSEDPLHQAICSSSASGVTYAAAAGNDGVDFGSFPPDEPAWFPEVLAVTAMSDFDGEPGGLGPASDCEPGESDDYAATFSNYATRPADAAHVIAAPGVCIESTVPGGGSETNSGTSASSPHVAGVVALCEGQGAAQGPCAGMTPAEVIQEIRTEAEANATVANGFIGDPLHPLGAYFGYLVSGADPGFRPTTAQPPPPIFVPSTTTGPPDKIVGLRLLRIPRVQDVDGLHVTLEMAEGGTASVKASTKSRISVARRRQRLFADARSRLIEANQRTRIAIRFRAHALRLLKRSLRRGYSPRLAVTVALKDQAGNSLVKRRGVRLAD